MSNETKQGINKDLKLKLKDAGLYRQCSDALSLFQVKQ